MLFSKKKGLSIDTLIGEGTAIDGDLVFSGAAAGWQGARQVFAPQAKAEHAGHQRKGHGGRRDRVGHLILNGTVKGPVHAGELLELQPHARVLGEVRYAALEMHQGALVEGRLVPLGQEEIKALPNPSPAHHDVEDAVDVPLPGDGAGAGKAA